ncbi:MAG: ribosome rescue protein RqcH [Thermoplasmata archaeon]
MKSQMTSFDIAAIVSELQACVGLRAEKFFLLEHRDFFFRLTGTSEKKSVTINLDHGIWLEDGFRTTGDSEPATFAMLLRKYISGKTLKKVSQHGFDRIVLFEFGSEPSITLVAELFGSGNLILLEGSRILQPLTSKSWKARDVKTGREYLFPPESQNPFTLDRGALFDIIRNSGKDIVRCLATEVNLGGVYSEEICARLGRERSIRASEISDGEIEAILKEIQSFKKSLESPAPHILLDGQGIWADVLPFELSMHENHEKKHYAGFSPAAKDYFEALSEKGRAPGKSMRESQLERQLESQTGAVKELLLQTKEYQEMGDRIYANYPLLESILQKAAIILGEGNWQALKKEVCGIPHVTEFDPATGTISVSLPDGSAVRLDTRNNLNENAAAFYDRSKKAKHKAEGARVAIIETEQLLRNVKKAVEKSKAKTDKLPTKKFWFDKFRWFMSSEGLIVVGGRDTRTNDQVVKKHLKDGDLYAHADVNGAPSVVIKDAAGATDATLEEACTFAVCFSRAWKTKLASGSAYWVKPDQVSKTPQPGEFVPKGAFIIRGKRNYSKKIELKLAIAMVKIQGSDKLMCGPVSAVRAHAGECTIIEPGDEKRSDFAKRISDKYNIPIEEVDKALPTGDIHIAED